MKWNIVTDSSCDRFPTSKQNGEVRLSSVPFVIRVGHTDYVDDEHLDIHQMVNAMEQETTASHTSCPSPYTWLSEFEQADYSIAITISSQLSGSMNSALVAKELALEKDPTKKIAVIDSRSTGPELVLCVEEIEKLIRRGSEFEDIVAHAERFIQQTQLLFALSSFDNLIKNGRMNRMTGFIAKKLGMWGIGSASNEGTIVIEGKTRGKKKALAMVLDQMQSKGYNGNKVAISHCDNLAFAETLKANIQELWKNAEVDILPTRGLCSYYAERGGLIVAF